MHKLKGQGVKECHIAVREENILADTAQREVG